MPECRSPDSLLTLPADRHLPGLDGLRAMLMVILCHGKLMAAGWIGVQLFFVLSGFLITRILILDCWR